jgi:hypothetical protein
VDTACAGNPRTTIEATLAHLDREIARVDREIEHLFDQYPPLRRQRDLLTSVPGIGETTAARILGEMPNIAEFRDVKAVAAYAGLSPRHYESRSIRRPSHIAKTGNGSLRTALYFPAICAMRYNPPLRRFAERLRERRKSNMTIITAVMRKLLTVAYGVLKSGQFFDPNYATLDAEHRILCSIDVAARAAGMRPSLRVNLTPCTAYKGSGRVPISTIEIVRKALTRLAFRPKPERRDLTKVIPSGAPRSAVVMSSRAERAKRA